MLGIARNNDVELVRRTLSGQRDAFGLLVDRYLRFAYAIAYARAHSRSDADDVVQDSFLTAYQQLNTLREPTRFSAWLATIVRRLSSKSNQRAKLTEAAETTAATSEVVHPEYEREELRALIRAEVHALDETDREVILLCYFAGRSTGEIALALESTPSAIRKRLQRARERLGERLLTAIADEPGPDTKQTKQIMGAIAVTTAAWESATSLTTATATTTIGGALAMKIVAFLAGIAALTGGIAAYQSSGTLAEPAPNTAIMESAIKTTEAAGEVPESPTAKMLKPATPQSEPSNEQPSSGPVQQPVKMAAADTTSAPSSAPKPLRFMGGGNAQHTNYWDIPSIMEVPKIAWQIPLPTSEWSVNSQPAVDLNYNVYIDYRFDTKNETGDTIDRNVQVASYTPSGELRWKSDSVDSGRSQSIPAFLPNGDLVHMFRNGSIRAFDTSNGHEKWVVPIFSPENKRLGPTAGPTIDAHGNIYSGGRWSDNYFVKISPGGEVLWKTRVPDGEKVTGAGASSPALSRDEKTVYVGWDEKRQMAPGPKQKVTVPTPDGGTKEVEVDTAVPVEPKEGNPHPGGLYALDAETGAIRWHFKDPASPIFAAAWAAPSVGTDGTIYQQDAFTGTVYAVTDRGDSPLMKWKYAPNAPHDAPRMLAIDSNAIYFGTLGEGDDRGVVGALSFNGEPIWLHVFPEGQEIGTPTVTRDAVYVTVQEFGLAALDKQTGNVLWQIAHKDTTAIATDPAPESSSTTTNTAPQKSTFSAEAGETVALGPDGTIYWAVTATIDHPENCVLMALKKP